MPNDVIKDDAVDPIRDAIDKVRLALDGMYIPDQLAVLAQITAYILIVTERRAGKATGKTARESFAGMLKNACAQWRITLSRPEA